MTEQNTRLPPQDLAAERAALGCAMLSEHALDEVLARLAEPALYEPRHRAVLGAMRALVAQQRPVDEVTVFGQLPAEEGLLPWLRRLVGEAPIGESVAAYIDAVIAASARRALIEAARDVERLARSSDESPAAIADRAAARMSEAVATHNEDIATSTRELARAEWLRIEEVAKGGGTRGLKTGLHDLDEALGGLYPGNLVVVAGRPAMGKTALATCMAQGAAENGAVVLMFSMEMSRQEIGQRLVASTARVDLNRIRDARFDEMDHPRLSRAMNELYNLSMHVNDRGGLRVLELRSLARRFRAQHGLGLIVVDYLQLMVGESRDSREREIAEVARGLKALAKELDVPIVALSQVSRACESREDKRPELRDLRESGSIEQDSDVVLFVYRDEYYDDETKDKDITEVIIRKNRNGASGHAVKLRWSGRFTRVDNLYRRESA